MEKCEKKPDGTASMALAVLSLGPRHALITHFSCENVPLKRQYERLLAGVPDPDQHLICG
jgi:hypothetical protein